MRSIRWISKMYDAKIMRWKSLVNIERKNTNKIPHAHRQSYTRHRRKRKKSIKTCSMFTQIRLFPVCVRSQRERNYGWIRMRERTLRCVRAYVRMWMEANERAQKREAAFEFVQPPLFRALLHDKTNTRSHSHSRRIVHPIRIQRAVDRESTRHIEFLHWIQTSESLSIIIIIVISPIDFFFHHSLSPINRCNFN